MKNLSLYIIMLAMSLCSSAGTLTDEDKKHVWQQAYMMELGSWELQGLGSIEQALYNVAEKMKDGMTVITGVSYRNASSADALNNAYDNAAMQLAFSRGYSYSEVTSVEYDENISGDNVVDRSRGVGKMILDVTAKLPVPSLVVLRENDGRYDCMAMYVIYTE